MRRWGSIKFRRFRVVMILRGIMLGNRRIEFMQKSFVTFLGDHGLLAIYTWAVFALFC